MKKIVTGLLMFSVAVGMILNEPIIKLAAQESEDATQTLEVYEIEELEKELTQEEPFIEEELEEVSKAALEVSDEDINKTVKIALIDTEKSNEDIGYTHGDLMREVMEASVCNKVEIVEYAAFDEKGIGTVGSVYRSIMNAISDNVSVISISASGYGKSNMLTRAIQKAKKAGIYVVVAAGNDGKSASDYMPGNIDEAITVSAISLDENGEYNPTNYSNFGEEIDFSTLGIYQKDEELYEGTSVAAAYLSSYLASLLLHVQDDTNTEEDEVLEALKLIAKDLGEEGKDEFFGYGFISLTAVNDYMTQILEEKNTNEEIIPEPEEEADAVDENTKEEPAEENTKEETYDEEDASQSLKTAGYVINGATCNDVGMFYILLDKTTSTTTEGDQEYKASCRSSFRSQYASTLDLAQDITLPSKTKLYSGGTPHAGSAGGDVNFDTYCTINGNNHGINCNGQTLVVDGGVVVTLNNCNIYGGTDNITVHEGGVLYLNNCVIHDTVGGSDNNIYVASRAFATITNCTSYNNANGTDVRVKGGTAHIRGGDYSGCGYKGAICVSDGGVANIGEGAYIHNCTSGIKNTSATVNVDGNTTRITASTRGIENRGTVSLQNYVGIDNCSVGVENYGTLNLYHCNISACTKGIYNGSRVVGYTDKEYKQALYDNAHWKRILMENNAKKAENELKSLCGSVAHYFINGEAGFVAVYKGGISGYGENYRYQHYSCAYREATRDLWVNGQYSIPLSAFADETSLQECLNRIGKIIEKNERQSFSMNEFKGLQFFYQGEMNTKAAYEAFCKEKSLKQVFVQILEYERILTEYENAKNEESATYRNYQNAGEGSSNRINGGIGIENYGTIDLKNVQVTGGSWGVINNGNFSQNGTVVNGGVYQNGVLKMKSGACVPVGDVYLTKGHIIEVNGALNYGGKIASIDAQDNRAGVAVVKVTYVNQSQGQSLCSTYLSQGKFILSQALIQKRVSTGGDDQSEVAAVYNHCNGLHEALLRAGRGDQRKKSESENYDLMKKSYTNGEMGTIVLSCYLNVNYELSEISSITKKTWIYKTGKSSSVSQVSDKVIWKEGFSSSNTSRKQEWNSYLNHTNYSAVMKNQENTSFVFLGWCLDKNGNGMIYDTPTSFPAGNNYTWYPIFDVQYDVEYNANLGNSGRTNIGGKLIYSIGDENYQCNNSTNGFSSMNQSALSYVVSWGDSAMVRGNTGKDNDKKNYYKKQIDVTNYQNLAKQYEKKENSGVYTYRYSFQGWSMNPKSKYSDWRVSDITTKLYKEGNYFTSNNSDRTSKTYKENALERYRYFRTAMASNCCKIENGRAIMVVYACWDEYPQVWGYNRTFSSDDIKNYNSDSLKNELIKKLNNEKREGVYYTDFEDGSYKLELTEYDYNDFVGIGDWSIKSSDNLGGASANLKVTDGAGNMSYYPIQISVLSSNGLRSKDHSGAKVSLYTRFIDKENWLKNPYFNEVFQNGKKDCDEYSEEELKELCKNYELWLMDNKNLKEAKDAFSAGACEPYSAWYTNPKKVKQIYSTLQNL